ncbi:protein kinase [Variovorax paradoxus]|nr:protein kinase [Variovorax paradoxus]
MRTVPGPVTGVGALERPPPAWDAPARDSAHTLAEGTRLLDYEIVGPIGEGGFGIVYLAWDHVQERHVAIKEYLPAVLASRASVSPGVVLKSERHGESFRVGLRSFVNEARILARFDHPALVRVLHFWEDNGTAYMAMPYYTGPTLARALAELGRPPEEAELIDWLRPLVDALATMHALSCFHRDIAPDNILLTDSGPVLLDFGAARRVIDGMGPSPTVVFKPGFAPIEQCGEGAAMKQGAWTDLYALASVVYMAVAGRAPVPSIERLMGAPLQPLSELARGRYSVPFLAAVDAAMALHPHNRPQSVAEFWTQLNGGRTQPAHAAPSPSKRRGRSSTASALAATVLLIGLAAAGYHRFGDPLRAAPQASLAALPASPVLATPATAVAPVAPGPPLRALALLPPGPLGALELPSSAPEPAPRLLAVPPSPKTASRAPAEPSARAQRRAARRQASEAPPSEAPAVEAPERPVARVVARSEAAPEHTPCTEILQRASLGPLSSGELALLRRGCE